MIAYNLNVKIFFKKQFTPEFSCQILYFDQQMLMMLETQFL